MKRALKTLLRLIVVLVLGLGLGLGTIRTGLIQTYAPVEGPELRIAPDLFVEYARRGALTLKLHFFLPDDFKETDSRPAVLLFHGGTWKGGHPKRMYSQCEYLADNGLVAISASYRLMGKGGLSPLDCVTDARAAFEWLIEHGPQYGVDPERIAVGGGSAGGHVGACVGLMPVEEGAPRPRALVLFNPPLDLSGEAWPEEFMTPQRKALMTVFGDQALEISPLRYVDQDSPPTILFHGDEDKSVPFQQSVEFSSRMEQAGVRCDFHPYEGRTHGFYNKSRDGGKDFDQTMCLTIEFLASLGLSAAQPPG